jgi:hypothetical protein
MPPTIKATTIIHTQKEFLMNTARAQQRSLVDTAYFNIMSRCVRRADLCGTDKLTGQCKARRAKRCVIQPQQLP